MKKTVHIHIEDVEELLEKVRGLNSLDLREVKLIEKGKVLDVGDDVLEEWRFVGLSNEAFFESRFWEEKKLRSAIRRNHLEKD